jgi:hypothetical protein
MNRVIQPKVKVKVTLVQGDIFNVTIGKAAWEACSAKVKVKVTLRPKISRPVRLGVSRPSGTRDQFFYLLEIFF